MGRYVLLLVYPRTYGEHYDPAKYVPIAGGLSPYLRGTQFQSPFLIRHYRFIPVPTGNTTINSVLDAQ
ncbi:hypothetical protein XBJ1_3759 [Xenorhabdus bovienii SS-2004]|nr:hypothetical protein XBJ1_3759 [Xenorhabdus bovienii SS-2004]